MEFVAELANLALKIGDKHIFKSISMTVPDRGCTVLLGPSGTGKSTLLRVLSGQMLEHPSVTWTGDISVSGVSIEDCAAALRPALVGQKAVLLVGSVWESIVGEWSERALLTQIEQRARLAAILRAWEQDDLIPLYTSTVLSLSGSQRGRLAIVRKALSGAPLLMLDEPTANLSQAAELEVLNLIGHISENTPVLVVTHKVNHAQKLADHVVLIASGVVKEQAVAADFFGQPSSESGRQFLRTGSCAEDPIQDGDEILFENTDQVNEKTELNHLHINDNNSQYLNAAPHADINFVGHGIFQGEPATDGLLAPKSKIIGCGAVPAPVSTSLAVRARGPRGFTWIVDGVLAGTPLPGLLTQVADDLRDLHDTGVTHLLSLTEVPFPAEIAQAFGISCSALPMPDMAAPSMDDALDLCRWMDTLRKGGHVIAVHCKAGLGRTGTVLCMYWMWMQQGTANYQQALQFIRSKNSGMIQSVSQEEFLQKFSQLCESSYLEHTH